MKSRLRILDLKGFLAILILVVGTTATALISDWQPTAAAEVTDTTTSQPAKHTHSLATTWKYGSVKLPFNATFDASVTTDREDYSPGQVANITGSGFQAGEAVVLQVAYADSGLKQDATAAFAQHSGHDPWTVLADNSGNINSSWLVEMDSFGRTLLLTADGQSSGFHAEHIFTDAVGKDFRQCSNNNGSAGLGRCVWINGIIQQSNSLYFEGMSTLQRLVLDAIPTTGTNDHTLIFHDDFTKGGIHAYDFLTSWPQAVEAADDAGVPYVDLSGGTLNQARTCGDGISASAAAICNAVFPTTNFIDVAVPNDAYVSHDGSVQLKIDGYEAKYGNRTVRIYGNAPFTSASFVSNVHDVANNADTGDSIITYTLTWRSASTNVMLLWGEHIALGTDGNQPGVGWGAGKGASSISGGPYHVSLDGIDGASLGSVDNQLKGADVLPPPPAGSITIVKDSIPDDAQSFNFTASGTPAPSPAAFTLNDDSGGIDGVPHTQAYANLPAGTYNFAEILGVSGWSLTNIACTSAGGSSSTPNVPAGTVAVTLASNDAVTCIFTNTKDATLRLVKALNYTHGGTRPATDWTTSASGPTPISGAGGVGPTVVQPGAYTLSETGTFTGYTNGTTYSCVKNGGAPVVDNSISLAAGDNAVCTITNTDNPASLRLIKALNYTHGGTRPATDWTPRASGPTPKSGAGGVGPSNVNAGAYTLSETGTYAGYTNGTTYSCVKNAGAPVVSNSISLAVGDTAVCTITNADNFASLRLIKALNYTNGGTRPATDWTTSASGPTPISGAGGVGPSNVNAGAYTLSETGTFAGYTNGTTYSCVKTPAGGSPGAPVVSNSISLAVGDSAVCTITNADSPASLRLIKALNYTHGGTRPATDWTTSAAGPTPISGAGGVGPSNVSAGAYTLSETGTFPGYTNGTTYSCVKNGGAPVVSNSISLAVGDTAVCTITNADNFASLQLIKALNYTHGGTRAATDWTTSASGPSPISGAGGVGPSNVNAGAYTLSETGTYAGYSNGTTYSCVKTLAGGSPGAPVVSNSLSLAVGDSAVCTITNSDIAPRLRVTKILDPASDPGLFNLQIDGTTRGTGGDVGDGGTTGFISVNAGLHTAGETAGTGTSLDNYVAVIGGDCGTNGNITVAVGDPDKTCTITNHRLPSLKIRKVIQGVSTEFNFTIAGNPTNPVTTAVSLTPPTDGEITSSGQNIQLGNYTVTEVNIPDNWILTDGSCVSDAPTGFVTSNTVPGLPALVFTARYGDDVTCSFIDNELGGTTRTQGFWATHTLLANTFWNGGELPPGTSGQLDGWIPVIDSEDAYLCDPPTGDPPTGGTKITAIELTGQNQMMGGFWSGISQRTVMPKKRTALDQARMQLLQQYLAAVLNVHAFGTPIVGTTLANARSAYCGTNAKLISGQMALLAAYNESGDNGEFTPGANATAQLSRRQADIPFWDVTLH